MRCTERTKSTQSFGLKSGSGIKVYSYRMGRPGWHWELCAWEFPSGGCWELLRELLALGGRQPGTLPLDRFLCLPQKAASPPCFPRLEAPRPGTGSSLSQMQKPGSLSSPLTAGSPTCKQQTRAGDCSGAVSGTSGRGCRWGAAAALRGHTPSRSICCQGRLESRRQTSGGARGKRAEPYP